jgi:hypothetical protein
MEWALLRKDQGHDSLIGPARNTLKQLAASPLFDARDGGFHRMAAAPDWGSIQYEKLLEVNVELIRELVFALKNGDDPALAHALRATARFVTTVLARPSAGFYLAQMADPTSPDGGGYWTTAVADSAKAPPVDKLTLAAPTRWRARRWSGRARFCEIPRSKPRVARRWISFSCAPSYPGGESITSSSRSPTGDVIW